MKLEINKDWKTDLSFMVFGDFVFEDEDGNPLEIPEELYSYPSIDDPLSIPPHTGKKPEKITRLIQPGEEITLGTIPIWETNIWGDMMTNGLKTFTRFTISAIYSPDFIDEKGKQLIGVYGYSFKEFSVDKETLLKLEKLIPEKAE